jgi:hypothetical protein
MGPLLCRHWYPGCSGREVASVTGIQFITDEKGRKTAAVIDLRRHKALWEDFWDGVISETRRKEPGIPFDRVKSDLIKRGRLRG